MREAATSRRLELIVATKQTGVVGSTTLYTVPAGVDKVELRSVWINTTGVGHTGILFIETPAAVQTTIWATHASVQDVNLRIDNTYIVLYSGFKLRLFTGTSSPTWDVLVTATVVDLS